MFLPGESQGQGSLVGCHLWGCTESDVTEVTWQQAAGKVGAKREVQESGSWEPNEKVFLGKIGFYLKNSMYLLQKLK